MTTYDFKCTSCNKAVELDLPVEKAGGEGIKCPFCSKKTLQRVYSFYSKTSGNSSSGGNVSCPTGSCPFVN